MKELKNPFALRKSDGHIIMIADLSPEQRGKSCNCVCPECNADFLARMGDIRVPHFAHSGEPCDAVKALMGALYQLMQEALRESKRFTVPDVYGYCAALPSHYKMDIEEIRSACKWSAFALKEYSHIIKRRSFEVDCCEITKDSRGIANGIILVDKKSRHRLAVVLTPPKTVCKIPKAKPLKDLPTVAIDLSEIQDFNHQKSEYIKSLLLESIQYKVWLTSPKIEDWVQECAKSQHEQYATWCENRRRAAKERRSLYPQSNSAPFVSDTCSKQNPVAQDEGEMLQKINAVIQSYRKHRPSSSVPEYGDDEELSAMRFYFTQKYPRPPVPVTVKDFRGEEWSFCTSCNTWYHNQDMTIYGGTTERQVNERTCSACARKLR